MVLFFFYCCCVFPLLNNALPPQGPITAHQSVLSEPPPLIPPSLSRFPHLAQAHFHISSHCLSKGSTRRAAASPNMLISQFGWSPALFKKTLFFPNQFNSCVLIIYQRYHFRMSAFFFLFLYARTIVKVCVCHIFCRWCIHACVSVKVNPNLSWIPPEEGQPLYVCSSLSPVRKEAWSVFSGQSPFGWGSAPLYWPLCDSLIELSCQQAAQSQCRVHYVIQAHSGAPREVLGSPDNSTAPSSNTQSRIYSMFNLYGMK